ncbi:unnamed protein product [Linum tenue]|uniref:Uncharacterized protein n=1 Tax=Linum tenue TaxID=586396 RepID=A0AAV0RA92_9ROSI|nr:unnamed protein product [Linum tenue]
MGIHLVLPRHLNRLLPRRRHLPPPPPRPNRPRRPPPPHPSRPDPGPPQPHHGPNLRHDLRRDPPLRGLRDPRNPLVLAPDQNPIPVAPLLPHRNPPFRPGLLLVLHVLPLPIRPHAPHLRLHPLRPPPRLLPALQPHHPHRRVVPLARVLAEFSGPRDHARHHGLLGGVRVQVLDRDWPAGGLFSLCAQLPDCSARREFGLPCRSSAAAFHEGWV